MFNINYNLFKKDVEDIKEIIDKIPENKCLEHFHKIKYTCDFFYFVGIITLFLSPMYVIPWLFLSLGIFGKWTMIGHHVCHGGYDKISNYKFHRRKFGIKSFVRRFMDWFDWWYVEAWNIEHNNLHHYNLGEINDPDLVENNFAWRNLDIPIFLKYILIFIIASMWKWIYYAPNTYKYYCLNKLKIKDLTLYEKTKKKHEHQIFSLRAYILYYEDWMSGFFTCVLFPYFAYMFICIPFIYYSISYYLQINLYNVMYNVYCNIIIAEICTNLHSFLMIVTNHCGEDLYKFNTSVEYKSGEFYLRQIISSTNFTTGNIINDFLHGWLNYQIEHHLFPDLSMYQYTIMKPYIQNVCKKYNIPYIQQNVFIRLKKTLDIMTGKTSMKIFE